MKPAFRAAAVQLCAGHDKGANLAEAERLVRQAAAGGAELIVLPELFNQCGDLGLVASEAEPLDGPTARLLKHLARELNAWIVGGSFAEVGRGGRAFNTCLTIDSQGDVQGIYRKMHLFNVDLGPLRICEADNLLPGGEVGFVEASLAKIGISICYDVRFPEIYREQSRRGAELLCIPAAFTQKTGSDHWQLLVRARAVENQCFVVAANQVGQHHVGSVSYGHSLIVDPWGEVLAEASGERQEVICAEISAARLTEVRRSLPALKNRVM